MTPPPHLVGLRIDAIDALAAEPDAVVVAGATALAESIPDASLRPAGFTLEVGEDVDLGQVTGDLAAAGYERVDQVEERGQFAAARRHPRRLSRRPRSGRCGSSSSATRSSRRAGSPPSPSARSATPSGSSWRRRPSSTPSTASLRRWPRWRRPRRESGPSDLAELLPLDHFKAPLDLVPPERGRVCWSRAEEIEPALRDHWDDVTTAMHAADAQHLYVDVAAPLAARAALSFTGTGEDDEDAFRAARAESPARSIKEAEGELEKLVRSGYRTVVAFDGRGEAERARYNLDRLDATLLDGRPLSPEPGLAFAEARLREGFISPELRIAVYPIRRLVHRRRGRRRAPSPAPAAGGSPSATCGSATSSSTRTTASPASPASRRARSAA